MVTRCTPVGSQRPPAQRRKRTLRGSPGTPAPPYQHSGAASAGRQDDAGTVQGNAPVRENQQAQSSSGYARQQRRRGYGTPMPDTKGGRKETIARPPHYPVYSFGA